MYRLPPSDLFRTILASAGIVAVRVAGTGFTFLYTVMMARTLPAHDVGVIWAIWASSFLFATFVTLNIGAGSIREIVKARVAGDDAVASGFITVGRNVLLLVAPLVMMAFLALAWMQDAVAFDTYFPAYILAALSLPVLGWVQLNATQAAAMQKAFHSQASRELVRPILFTVGFGLALLLGLQVGVTFAIGLFLLATLATGLMQFGLLRSTFAFRRNVQAKTSSWKQWLTTGLMLMPTRILGENLKNLFIVSAALAVSSEDTARLSIAFSLVTFLNFGISAIEMTFNPKVSEAIAQNKPSRVSLLLAVSAGLRIVPIAIASVLLVLLAEPLLAIFGPQYPVAAGALAWLLLLPVSKAVFGPSETLLIVNGDRTILFWMAGLGIVAMFAGVSVGAQVHDLAGAAMGGGFAYAVLQFISWLVCRARTGTDPSIFGAGALLIAKLSGRAV